MLIKTKENKMNLSKIELQYIAQELRREIMQYEYKNEEKPFLNNILRKVNDQIDEIDFGYVADKEN